jgi:hypothetical protein
MHSTEWKIKAFLFAQTIVVLDGILIHINSWKGESCPCQKISCITDLEKRNKSHKSKQIDSKHANIELCKVQYGVHK